jgi:hypothetical protein
MSPGNQITAFVWAKKSMRVGAPNLEPKQNEMATVNRDSG